MCTDTDRSFPGAQRISWVESKGAGGWIVQLNVWAQGRDVSETHQPFSFQLLTFWTQWQHFHWHNACQWTLIHYCLKKKLSSFLKVLFQQVFTLCRSMRCVPSYQQLPESYWQSTSQMNRVGAEWEPFLGSAKLCIWHGEGWHLWPSLSNLIFLFLFQSIRVS